MYLKRNIKLIVSVIFMVTLAFNLIMYFYMVDSVNIFGQNVDVLYIQLIFILLELFMLSAIYGKKQGIVMCLIYLIVVTLNLWFGLINLV